MRTSGWLLVVLVACGDDGGGSGIDAAGSGSDAGGMDMGTGLTGSLMFASPTDIAVGDTGGGTLAPLNSSTLVPQHFWRFVPPTSGNYRINLNGTAGMAVNWCGNFGSEQGCGCFMSPTPPQPCCTVATGGCMAITRDAMAADDGILVVFNDGAAMQGSYTITLEAP
ncbi:MAG: hypothetical protein ACKV2T_01815 [Kofleriaceae bacterium]